MRLTLLAFAATAQAVTQSSFSDLVNGAAGQATTLNGWDAMVAYDFNALQQVIANEIQSKPKVLQIPSFKSILKDPFSGKGTTTAYTFALTLTVPKVSIINETGYLDVKFPLAGTYQSGKKKTAIPKGITIAVKAPLYSTSTGISKKIPAMKTAQLGPNQRAGTLRVCFELEPHSTTLQGFGGIVQQSQTKLTLLAHLKSHFQAQQVEYCLSSIDVTRQFLTSELSTFVPNAITMSTIASDGANPGALLLWLGFGTTAVPALKHPRGFDWNSQSSTVRHPIPTGYTSALWFSHDFLMNKFMIPSLATKFDSVTANDSSDNGLGVSAKFRSFNTHYEGLDDDNRQFPGLDFNCNDEPFVINLAQTALPVGSDPLDRTNSVASLLYESDMQYLNWRSWWFDDIAKRSLSTDSEEPSEEFMKKVGGRRHQKRDEHMKMLRKRNGWWYGQTRITYSAQGAGAWSTPDAESMLLTIALPNSMSADYEWHGWQTDLFDHRSANLPGVYTGWNLPAVPNVGPITVGPINFKLASSLIADDRYGFKAAGANYIAVPWDMVIAGDIVNLPDVIKTKDTVPWTRVSQVDYGDATLQSINATSYQACRNACDRYVPSPWACSAAVYTYFGPNKGNCDLKQAILSPFKPAQGVYTYGAVRSVEYTTKSGLVWQRTEGIDYPGSDLPIVAAKTWEACLEACDSYSGSGACLGVVWTLEYPNNPCFLKTSMSSSVPVNNGAVMWSSVRPAYVSATKATYQPTNGIAYQGDAKTLSSYTSSSLTDCIGLCEGFEGPPLCAGVSWVYDGPDDTSICYLMSDTSTPVDASTVFVTGVTISASRTMVNSKGKTWTLQTDTDYPGNDMDTSVQPTYDACKARCDAWSDPKVACVGFVWVYYGQGDTYCDLKSAMNNPQPVPDGLYLWSGQSDNGCRADWCKGVMTKEAEDDNYDCEWSGGCGDQE